MKQNNQKCEFCRREFKSNRIKKYCPRCSNSSTRRMIKNRDFIKKYKEGKSCELCGYNKYPKILEFHHKENDSKDRGVNILMKSLKNLDVIKKEIDKCILICPNCHRELHFVGQYGK